MPEHEFPRLTPLSENYRYTNQDFDERQAVLCDLQANRSKYLSHPDPMVRSCADWTLEFWGIRQIRVKKNYDQHTKSGALNRLYCALRRWMHAGCPMELKAPEHV